MPKYMLKRAFKCIWCNEEHTYNFEVKHLIIARGTNEVEVRDYDIVLTCPTTGKDFIITTTIPRDILSIENKGFVNEEW